MGILSYPSCIGLKNASLVLAPKAILAKVKPLDVVGSVQTLTPKIGVDLSSLSAHKELSMWARCTHEDNHLLVSKMDTLTEAKDHCQCHCDGIQSETDHDEIGHPRSNGVTRSIRDKRPEGMTS